MRSYKTGIALGTTLLLWASAFAGIRAGLLGYSPVHVAVFRFIVASGTLAVLAMFKGIRRPSRADIPRLIIVGLIGIAVYNVVLNYGELTVRAGAASFIVNIGPIFIALLSIALLHERVQPLAWLGMLISLAGVGLIALGESGGVELNSGAFLVLCAAVCQSLYFVLQKPLLQKYDVFTIVCYSLWIGTVALLAFVPGLLAVIKTAPISSTLAIVYLGVFPGAIGYACWSYVLSKTAASRAGAYLYIVPAISIVIAYVWLGELSSWVSLVGGSLALSGVLIVNVFGKKPALSPRPITNDAAEEV